MSFSQGTNHRVSQRRNHSVSQGRNHSHSIKDGIIESVKGRNLRVSQWRHHSQSVKRGIIESSVKGGIIVSISQGRDHIVSQSREGSKCQSVKGGII